MMAQEVAESRIDRILFLEGGRYLFIQHLTAAQRMIGYHCVVNSGMPMRAPTTYTLTVNLAIAGINLFKDLGIMVGAVGEPVDFVFAATAASATNTSVSLAVTCTSNNLVMLGTFIVTATLTEVARNVNFTCITGALGENFVHLTLGSIIVSSKSLLYMVVIV